MTQLKIKQVEIFDIHCPKRPAWSPVFVRITTDEGISGVGEAGLAYDLGHKRLDRYYKVSI